MTVFRHSQGYRRLPIRKAVLEAARLSWLRIVLQEYVPRRSVWAVFALLGSAFAVAAISHIQPEPEGIEVAYSVDLRPPPFAAGEPKIEEAPKAEEPAKVEEPPKVEEIAKAEIPVEKPEEPKPPEPEPVVEKIVQAPVAPPVEVAAPAAPEQPVVAVAAPAPAPTNGVGRSEATAPQVAAGSASGVAQQAGPAGPPAPASGNRREGAGGGNGIADSAYWMSVREAVAAKLVYPNYARTRGIEGRIVISLTLDKRGRIVNAKPLDSGADQDLVRAALNGIRRAQPFRPPELASDDRTVTAQLPIQFKLVN
jgi:periplasmic protein TonB